MRGLTSMNERLRFSWGHIIAFVALIAVSYTSFVGYTYLTGGNFLFGAIGMVVTDIVFILVFIGAQQLKATDHKLQRSRRWERILIFGSPIVFLAGMIAMTHFWTVYSRNDEVVANFNNALSSGKGIFDDYKQYADQRLANYDNTLTQIIAMRESNPELYRRAGFTPGIERMQKDNMMEVLKLQLISGNFDTLRNEAVKWIDKANRGASTFNVFLIGNTREIQQALISWEDQLKGYTTKRLSNEQLLHPVAEFDTNAGRAAARQIESLGQSFTSYHAPTVAAVIFGIVIYFMMIFPYLIQDRHSKGMQGTGLFGSTKKNKNESDGWNDSANNPNRHDKKEVKYQEDSDYMSF